MQTSSVVLDLEVHLRPCRLRLDLRLRLLLDGVELEEVE